MTDKRKIIGFAGRKRSGKTCLARALQENYDAKIITIADYLKKLCCELLEISYDELILKKDNGYTFSVKPDERWFEIINDTTGIRIEDIEQTIGDITFTDVRQMLQVIGTDLIRKFEPNWHVGKMLEEIKFDTSPDRLIVVDDVRFPNEREAIEKLGGEVFFIIRTSDITISNHESETSLLWHDFDERHIICNWITKDVFVKDFLQHFNDGFKTKYYDSLFLHENLRWLQTRNFAREINSENKELIDYIVSKIKYSDDYYKRGIIRFTTGDRKIKSLMEKYYSKDVCTDEYDLIANYFISNPCIIENFKRYL